MNGAMIFGACPSCLWPHRWPDTSVAACQTCFYRAWGLDGSPALDRPVSVFFPFEDFLPEPEGPIVDDMHGTCMECETVYRNEELITAGLLREWPSSSPKVAAFLANPDTRFTCIPCRKMRERLQSLGYRAEWGKLRDTIEKVTKETGGIEWMAERPGRKGGR